MIDRPYEVHRRLESHWVIPKMIGVGAITGPDLFFRAIRSIT